MNPLQDVVARDSYLSCLITTGSSLVRMSYVHCCCSNTVLRENPYGCCVLLRNCMHLLNSLLHDGLLSL